MAHSTLTPLTIQTNPCVRCGACCAYFRVSFYWAEADDGGGQLAADDTERISSLMRCMRGTNSKRPRCIYLCGDVGQAVSCRAYAQRPTPCRDFMPSGENGQPNPACDRARAAYGLPPLSPRTTAYRQNAEEITT
ncbi:YkgJ family cysteine cluster protein [Edwardsiella tarda]|uniref:YkgJ family cysteine cluster protein n=1 Tax=Edwardsiella tarda TaxID=636 RepID=UPI00098FE05B|nr:YkgJ family cysteine cluster protein [Edwardsiella tarda]